MSIALRSKKIVLKAVEAVLQDGRTEFRPGDIADHLRARNQPMGTWEIRGVLSALEADGAIQSDPDTGAWRQSAQPARKAG